MIKQLILVLTFTASIQAQELKKQVFVEIEWISLPSGTVTKIIKQTKSSSSPLRSAVQKLIINNLATVINHTATVATTGETARIESVLQMIYPTEYTTGSFDMYSGQTFLNWRVARSGNLNNSSFEERPVGSVFEFEPTVVGDRIYIDIEPEMVNFLGIKRIATHTDKWGHNHGVMPNFSKYTTKTSTTQTNHSYQLISITPKVSQKGPLNHDTEIALFIRASIIK